MSSSDENGKSIMSEIDRAEVDIKACLYRLDLLERNLRFKPMTNEEREQSEKDIQELKKILKQQENDLKELRKQNQTSVFYTFFLIFGAIVIFAIYYMISHQEQQQQQLKTPHVPNRS